MELPRRIPYNPRWRTILGCGGFFGAGSVIMAHEAIHNKSGLIIEDLIHLDPAGATVFYWVITFICIGFALLSVLLAAQRIASPRVLEIDTDALYLPSGRFQQRISRIAYTDIQSISVAKVKSQLFLHITSGGRRYTITSSLLPDAQTFADIKALLVARTQRQNG